MTLTCRKGASILLAASLISRVIPGQADPELQDLLLRPEGLDKNRVTQVQHAIPPETIIYELKDTNSLNTSFFRSPATTNDTNATESNPASLETKTEQPPPSIISQNQGLIDSARKGIFNFFNDNLLSILALGTAAVLAFRRIFPNEWDIENVSLVKLNDKTQAPTICTTTLANKHLSEVYGLDFPAFLNFHYALLRTRKNHHLPIVIFKDLPINQIFSDSPIFELLKKGRSHVSAALLGQMHGENLDTHAQARFNNAPPVASEYLMVFTYEYHGVVKPRAFLIPTHDVINIMCDLKTWWEAAKDSSDGCRRRLVRNIEMAVCFLLRYPGVFDKKFADDPKLIEAKKTARDLFRMLALSPQKSETFIEEYLSSEKTREQIIKPSQKEKDLIFKTWYGTSDKAKWHKFAGLEKGLTSFGNYLKFCESNRIPPWFVPLLKTCEGKNPEAH